ncbi:MAG: T9SS type A sorting domain-containing protein [Flavobacteriaceae bacterium]|nr:T9SS type A sorting domain-containing protein [Flavobacteriaceae bacterium]
MKNFYLPLCLLLFIGNFVYGQIVNIPDPAFKDTLVNDPVVDFDMDGTPEADVDTNNDGEIQVSEALAVEVLITVGQNITSAVGIEEFTNLKTWFCSYNDLTVLDFSQNPNLEEMVCAFNELTSIDVTNNPLLKRLDLDINHLQELDVSNNPNLERLWVSFNELTTLDITNNPNLKNVNIDSNFLTSIDLFNNPLLELLRIDQNELNEIDLSNNTALYFVEVYGNNLQTLDVSNNPNLEFLTCLNNNLNSLNISNGNNVALETFNAINNPALSCIQVDNVPYANSRDDWQVDEGIDYSENCLLAVGDFLNATVQIFPNPAKDQIQISFSDLVEPEVLEIYNALGKQLLRKSATFETIDVSSFASGILFLKIYTSEGNVITKKIAKT